MYVGRWGGIEGPGRDEGELGDMRLLDWQKVLSGLDQRENH